MTKDKTVRAPHHLSASSRRWFKSVTTTWQLDEHHVKLLASACECLDRAAEARKTIQSDGAYVKNRFGEVRKHPALSVERDSLISFARILRELDLDIEPPVQGARPPGLHSIRGGRNAS